MNNLIGVRYIVEFGASDGSAGRYIGETMEEVHEQIDEDDTLIPWIADSLKYGYFFEFIDRDYLPQTYVIDNCVHFNFVKLLYIDDDLIDRE